jgi:hypothetical protein
LSTRYLVASAGVLGLATNADKVGWSWGSVIPEGTAAEFDACRVRMRLDIADLPEPIGSRYHYFYGTAGQDCLDYDRTFVGGRRLRMRAERLLTNEPVLTANATYLRWIKHRFMNLHSLGYILTDMAALTLLRNGFTPLHASAFKAGDAGVLVLAAPNTGKTLTVMTACMDLGASFISEDLAISDGHNVYGVPWTSTFRYYSKIDDSRRSRFAGRLTQVFPPAELVPMTRSRQVDTLISPDRLVASTPITHVVVLERGAKGVQASSVSETWRKAVNLNRFEFKYNSAPLLVAHEFFNPELGLDAAAAEERRLLQAIVDSAQERLVVRSDDPNDYASLILEATGGA